MNVADAVNPFFMQHDTSPTRDEKTKLIIEAGLTTIYSALDELVISNKTELAAYATIVKDENDLRIFGLDVKLAGHLLHQDRGPLASRNISIHCRKLTILGGADEALTIDVSAYVDDKCSLHIQPDVASVLASTGEKAEAGDDIAYALRNRSDKNPYTRWFEKDPGSDWAGPGAPGGSIRIACETLVLERKLVLRANGARGNAGIGGQNVKNVLPGLRGGDAGRGGRGGDSGTIQLVCSRVTDKAGNALNLSDWVKTECSAGKAGDPGLPGFALDGAGNKHFGSYAGSVPAGKSRDADLVMPADLPYVDDLGVPVTDASMVGLQSDLHFWALLYHRAKFEYLSNQPMQFRPPSGLEPGWKALGALLTWLNRLSFAYGDTSAGLKDRCFADVAADEQIDGKNSIARAMKLMAAWYATGKTMWGNAVTDVPLMPFSTLCSHVDEFFVEQAGVRDFYIRLRTELEKAIQANEALTTMRNSAEYAVRMHKAEVEELKRLLYGSTDHSGVDAQSLLGELNAADAACNAAIGKLGTDLGKLDDKINQAIGIGLTDVLDSIKSMCFVLGDPKAFLAMGIAEGVGLYDKAKNQVTDDAGHPMAKAAVIKQVHELKGNVEDLSKMVNGMVPNGQVGKLDQAILTSLDNIDQYVSRFTTALGDVGKDVLDEIGQLRAKVNYKNELWLDYNDTVFQLAKQWEDYQRALAKKQEIDTSNPQELSANLINAVQLYTGIYLTNLERSADLWARLVRKYAYVTLDADLPGDGFVGDVSAFWNADRSSAQGIADQANRNWDIDKNAVVGGSNSRSIRYQLGLYNASSQAIVIKAPSDEASDKKSTFYVDVRGDGTPQERDAIARLLRHQAVWLQVVPPREFDGKYTDENGEPADPPKIGPTVLACPLVAGRDWDVRVTHVNPWIEGVLTDSDPGVVQFHIKLGPRAYIVNAAAPPVARYYGYGGKAVNTQFAHLTRARLSDPTNADIAGDAAGEVSDDNIDKRGIFLPLQLAIPDGGLNVGLRVATDPTHVRLRIHFRVIFRASITAAVATHEPGRSLAGADPTTATARKQAAPTAES